jgi:hypothetical protein
VHAVGPVILIYYVARSTKHMIQKNPRYKNAPKFSNHVQVSISCITAATLPHLHSKQPRSGRRTGRVCALFSVSRSTTTSTLMLCDVSIRQVL